MHNFRFAIYLVLALPVDWCVTGTSRSTSPTLLLPRPSVIAAFSAQSRSTIALSEVTPYKKGRKKGSQDEQLLSEWSEWRFLQCIISSSDERCQHDYLTVENDSRVWGDGPNGERKNVAVKEVER